MPSAKTMRKLDVSLTPLHHLHPYSSSIFSDHTFYLTFDTFSSFLCCCFFFSIANWFLYKSENPGGISTKKKVLFLFFLLFGWLVLMHPEVTVLIFSTQKLPGLCYFLRLMETQAWGASNCGQRGESRDLIFRISSITCNRNSLKTAKMSSDGISKLPIEKFKPWSPYLSLQGKTWSEMFLGQNAPPEAGRPTQLLDGNKISFCIIYFGISISSRGLLSAFLFVSVCGNFSSFFHAEVFWEGQQDSFSMEDLFRQDQQSPWSWGKE